MKVRGEPVAPGERKRGANVGVALRGGQAGLRRAVTNAPKHMPDRKSHLPRQVVGLVEAALQRPQRMKRDRNHRVRAREKVGAGGPQQRAERTREDAAAVVLERVDDLPERSVIAAGASRERDASSRSAAARAERSRRSPAAKRIAALNAARRRQPRHRTPTFLADRAGERMRQGLIARDASWREQHARHDVGRDRQHGTWKCNPGASDKMRNAPGDAPPYADCAK
jgi:hypothetical protein